MLVIVRTESEPLLGVAGRPTFQTRRRRTRRSRVTSLQQRRHHRFPIPPCARRLSLTSDDSHEPRPAIARQSDRKRIK